MFAGSDDVKNWFLQQQKIDSFHKKGFRCKQNSKRKKDYKLIKNLAIINYIEIMQI